MNETVVGIDYFYAVKASCGHIASRAQVEKQRKQGERILCLRYMQTQTQTC